MNNKDILILHFTLTLSGGVGAVIEELAREQIEKGYNVGFVFPADNELDASMMHSRIGNSEKTLLYPVHRSKYFKPIFFGLPIKKIYTKIYKTNFYKQIIVHIHNATTIGLIRNLFGISTICTLHGIDYKNTTHPLYMLVYKWLLRKPTTLTAVSFSTKIFFSSFTKKKIHVVHNGLRDNHRLHIRDNNAIFRIGFVGYIDNLKGWQFVLDGFNSIPYGLRDSMQLIFVGNGSEAKNLSKKIQEINKGNIQYLGEKQNAGDEIIPNLDLLILPSLSEGLPIVLLEAIRSGVPILATKVGGIPEILKEGITGFFIERNAQDIADKIVLLFNNFKLYQKISNQCVGQFNNEFTISSIERKYYSKYGI